MSSEGDRLTQEAQKLLSSAGGGFSFFGASKSDKYEQASEKYRDAGNAYRTSRQMMEAGRAFEKSADIQLRNLNEPTEGSRILLDASKAYREISPQDSGRVLEQSIKLFLAKGNFRRAADLLVDLAGIQEQLGDVPRALETLEKAIQFYTDESIPATANKARQQAGKLAAESGDLYKAIKIFLDAAKASLNTGPTGRFAIKTYLFKAGLCQLATGDIVGSTQALAGYNELDRSFDQEREGRFLKDLLDAMQANDSDKFGFLAQQWDSMSKMEDWQVTVLLEARNKIEPEAGEDDFS